MLSLSLFHPSLAWTQTLSDRIAAIVNAEVITTSELEAAMRDETIRLQARFAGKELQQRLVQKRHEVLNLIIERKLQLQEARNQAIIISDDELERALEQIRRNQPGATSLPPKELVREEIAIRRLMNYAVVNRVVVSPEEIRDYYNNEQELFSIPAHYHLKQILIIPNRNNLTDESLSKVEAVMNALQDGETFASLAELYSDGPEGPLGGDLGFMKKDELLAPIAKAMDGLQPGDISSPIETEQGIHILKLEEIQPRAPQAFEDVEELIRQKLFQHKTEQAHHKWLSSLHNKAYIEIRL